MKVIIFGASGMVGGGVLIECLEDSRVTAVLAIGRSACGKTHPKLREILRNEFFDYADIEDDLAGHDACFFCLGISAAGKNEEEYSHLTHDLTLAAAETLANQNPRMTFCYVSGQGTDSSERGRFMWARVKGRTENALLRLPFESYMFRPGFIQPMKGVRSKTPLYQVFYTALAPVIPLLRRAFPRYVTTSENVGRAMIHVAQHGYERHVLENPDINAAAHAA